MKYIDLLRDRSCYENREFITRTAHDQLMQSEPFADMDVWHSIFHAAVIYIRHVYKWCHEDGINETTCLCLIHNERFEQCAYHAYRTKTSLKVGE